MEKPTRPDNLLEALGVDFQGLSDEERAMKHLLTEEYTKKGMSLVGEVRKWRQEHPDASFPDALKALYEKEIAS